jgi:flagellar hook-associated protein 1 FlgK
VDVTNKLNAGSLSGLVAVRDGKIPTLISNLDTLAAGLANAFNAANRTGFDLNGDPGGDIFVPPPASGAGAAADLAVGITDTALLAASSDGSPGSNGNVANLIAVHDLPIAGGQKATDYYANIVFGVGSDVSNASAEQQASSLVLQQLQDQRGAISGVSLDEEAGNMIVYQRAYDASARLISTVNEMLDVAVNLGRY